MLYIESIYAKIEIICLTSVCLAFIFAQKKRRKAASQQKQACLIMHSICTFFATKQEKISTNLLK